MKCIGGSVQVRRAGRWVPRKLWILLTKSAECSVYIMAQDGHYYLRTNGLTANHLPWRWLKLPEEYRLYEGPRYPTVVHAINIVAATRQRLGVE